MSNQHARNNDEPVSSSRGRQWLDQQRGVQSEHETPGVQVIPIPDLRSASPSIPATRAVQLGNDEHDTVEADSFDLFEMETVRNIPEIDQNITVAESAVSMGIASGMTAHVTQMPEINTAASTPETKFMPSTETTEQVALGYIGTLKRNSEEVHGICSQLTNRFPGGLPCVISFCCSEENQKVEFTTAQTAVSLADKIDGRVLVIDGDFTNTRLSQWENSGKANGICDHLSRRFELASAIQKTNDPQIDFLPAGTVSGFDIKTAVNKLEKTVAELKSDYEVVCVNVGDAHSKSAGIWSQHSCGTYLLVSMENTSRTVAKSAVQRLESCGARVLGCVVSEVTDASVKI